MAKVKLGDVVRLKSGSPAMTVVLVCSEDAKTIAEKIGYEAYQQKLGKSAAYYGTNWFVGTKKEEGAFPEEVLEVDE